MATQHTPPAHWARRGRSWPHQLAQVLAKFPPTLVKLNFAAELHVWEALFHGFFYNPDVPESRDCYDVIVKFFNYHLGSGVKENP